jgi:hypothetical protein
MHLKIKNLNKLNSSLNAHIKKLENKLNDKIPIQRISDKKISLKKSINSNNSNNKDDKNKESFSKI